MIGQFRVIGKDCYLQVNKQGTLQSLPPIPWYWQMYFAFKDHFKGNVTINEVTEVSKRCSKRIHRSKWNRFKRWLYRLPLIKRCFIEVSVKNKRVIRKAQYNIRNLRQKARKAAKVK